MIKTITVTYADQQVAHLSCTNGDVTFTAVASGTVVTTVDEDGTTEVHNHVDEDGDPYDGSTMVIMKQVDGHHPEKVGGYEYLTLPMGLNLLHGKAKDEAAHNKKVTKILRFKMADPAYPTAIRTYYYLVDNTSHVLVKLWAEWPETPETPK